METNVSDSTTNIDAQRRFRQSTIALALILGVGTVGGLLVSRNVRAGLKSTQEVVITGPDSTMYATYTAQGSVGSARNSASTSEFIGCDFGMEFSGNNPNIPVRSGGCAARNAAGLYVACALPNTSDNWTTFAQAMATGGPTPYIYFKAIRDQYGNYTCGAMHMYSHSDHMVPVP